MRHRYLWWSLIIIGLMLILTTLMMGQIHAQDGGDEEKEYYGAKVCGECHSDIRHDQNETHHVLTLQKVDEDTVFAAFDQGEDARMVQFPGSSTPRPVKLEDVAYIVGSGRYVQRFLYAVAEDEYQVLPVEWNVIDQTWQPFTLADTWPDSAYDWTQNCAKCHTTGLNIEKGTWENAGVQCEACHGPGSLHVDTVDDVGSRPTPEELQQIRDAIYVKPDAQVCGQCHSRGMDADGIHPYPTQYLPGDDLLASYTLVAGDDPVHWWATGHAMQSNMQFNEWSKSSHAQALANMKDSDNAAPECLRCHSADYSFTQRFIALTEDGDRDGDAPTLPTLETAQNGVTCSGCHNPHNIETDTLLAVPDTYQTCINCHNTQDQPTIHHPNQEMFEGTTMVENVEGIPSAHFTAENGPECVTCHMASVSTDNGPRRNHTFQPILPGEAMNLEGLQDSCSGCHKDQADQTSMQQLIDDVQNSTKSRLEAARAAVTTDSPEWITTALDFVEGDGSLGIHNYSYTNAMLGAVEKELNIGAQTATGPQIEPAPANSTPTTEETNISSEEKGLASQSIVIMVAAVLGMVFAGWVFFVKQKGSAK
ncbi:MAG: hypothetical protein HY862_02880 [Chloroflexi bacterium]|nr:hypothetical protein [Chloroflexota bacterium]